MTPLIQDDELDVAQFVSNFTSAFQADVIERLQK